jgi:protein-S-isoprenylcysteine O-methyltransferase Ste14
LSGTTGHGRCPRYDPDVARIPDLGSRGEGWVLLQSVLLIAIPVAAWQASLTEVAETPTILLGRQVGAGLLVGALALIGVSLWLLRRASALSALPRPLDAGALVDVGPYRFIRHPIYAGLIVAGVAIALIRVSPVVAVLTAVLAVVLDLKRRREEAWLMAHYPAYAAYRSRTRALVPFLY